MVETSTNILIVFANGTSFYLFPRPWTKVVRLEDQTVELRAHEISTGETFTVPGGHAAECPAGAVRPTAQEAPPETRENTT